METYVHGYSETEALRLTDQADTLARFLHETVRFSEGSHVLEAGCGVGAQSMHLARNNPNVHFTAFDASIESVKKARERIAREGLKNIRFENADVFDLPYAAESFDHVFVCFLLEHLQDPLRALSGLKSVLKRGGSITVIEGDHGSYYCYPRSAAADRVVQCLIDIQAHKHGDALIGRRLYPLLAQAGFLEVQVVPRMIYVDASKPGLVEGFTKRTFIAMVSGVKEEAIALGLIDEKSWDQGIVDLNRTTLPDGTFCYAFFQATAWK